MEGYEVFKIKTANNVTDNSTYSVSRNKNVDQGEGGGGAELTLQEDKDNDFYYGDLDVEEDDGM